MTHNNSHHNPSASTTSPSQASATSTQSSSVTFADLHLRSDILKALAKQGYVNPTPIQEQAIPGLLLGKDLIGIAQTGTGKTAAFTLPILHRMGESGSQPRKLRTLVLAPTRELAAQIGESFATYGEFLKFTHTVIFGGVSQGSQVQALSRGVDIVIATPGRLLDLLNQRKLTLADIEFFVLDEADRMLDMGFIHDIKQIITKLPPKKQSLFFSATMSPQINTLAKSLLKNPVHVEITPQATTVERIKQCVFFVDGQSKEKLLVKLLDHEHLTSALVFTRTKHKANKVAQFLQSQNISADAIHGNKSQNARTKAISDFKNGAIKVLVATDIAARGIDIDNISHVINFELPNEPESYVHRIGRTARAGTTGTAYSFCCAEERNFLRDIESLTRQSIPVMDHDFHSETAKRATGSAAKPAPRQQFSRRSSGYQGQKGAKRFSPGTKTNSPRPNSNGVRSSGSFGQRPNRDGDSSRDSRGSRGSSGGGFSESRNNSRSSGSSGSSSNFRRR
jgi:ATP-dependent RNA helicase RhlE